MKLLSTTSLFAILLFALMGCGGGDEPEAAGGGSASISATMNDIYYGAQPTNAESPPVWTVAAGSSVRLSLENTGSQEHNWAIVNLGETVPDVYSDDDSGILLYEAGLVEGGASFSESFTAPSEPGSYTVICTVAGHYPSMQGVLEVQ